MTAAGLKPSMIDTVPGINRRLGAKPYNSLTILSGNSRQLTLGNVLVRRVFSDESGVPLLAVRPRRPVRIAAERQR